MLLPNPTFCVLGLVGAYTVLMGLTYKAHAKTSPWDISLHLENVIGFYAESLILVRLRME